MRLRHAFSLGLSLAVSAAVYGQQPAASRPVQPGPAQPGQGQPGQGQTNPAQPAPGKPGVQPGAPGAQPGRTQPGQVQPSQVSPFPATLHGMSDVGKALNLNQQQVNKLNELTTQTQNRYRDNYSGLGNLTPAERMAKSQELNRQYTADWMKGAQGIFNQDQIARYQQFHYQYGGFNSLANPDVQQRLNLTADQMKTLGGSIEWSNKRLQDIYQLSATDRNKADLEYRDYQQHYQAQLNKFLTPEQQRQWREMTGEPYKFQPAYSIATQP